MVTVEEITVPGCVECARFKKFWEAEKDRFPSVVLREIDALTPEGQEKVLRYQIFASPGIIINGELFSTGGVNREAFLAKLRELGGDRP